MNIDIEDLKKWCDDNCPIPNKMVLEVINRLQAAESKLEEMAKAEPYEWKQLNGNYCTQDPVVAERWARKGTPHIALFLHPQVQSNTDNEWHKAVLHECMMTEACYIESDPMQSIKNLIGWHITNSLFHHSAQSNADKEIEVPSEEIVRKTLDFIRCGIGANYGRESIDKTMELYHQPMSDYLYAQLNNQLLKTVSK